MNNEKKCKVCGKFFTKSLKRDWKSWNKRCCCSRKCFYQFHIRENHSRWNGGNIEKQCKICQQPFFICKSRVKKAKFCSWTCLLKYRSTLKSREHLSDVHKKRVANGLHNLYRGVSKENELARKSTQYKIWRETVFIRDDWTCQECGQRGEILNADHIKPFAFYPELRYEISNGRTLCKNCHQKTNTWGLKININLLKILTNQNQNE